MVAIWGDGVSLLGAGVPNGGTAGQILVKVDGADFNANWLDNSFANMSGNPADNVNLSTALAAKQNNLDFTPENTINKNQANGYAGLDGSGKVAATQLPSYVDDVLEFTNYAALPIIGETGKIYVTLSDNSEYRWSGSTYIQLVASPGSSDAVTEGSINKYFTAARVLATVLTGIGFGNGMAVTAADTILGALGKLQTQVTACGTAFDMTAYIQAAPIYNDEATALIAGLTPFTMYKTITGELRYKLENSVAPNSPTNGIVNDTNDTFTFTGGIE
jgi:hypothetical protein